MNISAEGRSALLFQRPLVVAALLLACTLSGHAATTKCPEHFAMGSAPEVISASLKQRNKEICFTAYAVLHSGVTRTPLWSAEHLIRDNLLLARSLKRSNRFHVESRLSPSDRAELQDYARSGFDRGHMSPSGDMPTIHAQQESFSLANMIPQDPTNNRQLWESIESAIRNMSMEKGELFVITGPLYQGERLKQLNGRILVPTHIYKAVYNPISNSAAAYVVENEATDKYKIVSIAELEKMAGIHYFPGVPVASTQRMLNLPSPAARGHRRRASSRY